MIEDRREPEGAAIATGALAAPPGFGAALRVWLRVGLESFGGPAGQIAVMHRVLVEERRWIDEARFLHGLNYCMLLPGPEAQQLATYIGWALHGTLGAIAAGALFVLPGALAMLALSVLYALGRDLALVAAVFYGLKPAVLAVVVEAVVRIGKRALCRPWSMAIAAAAFVAIFFLAVPFPLVIAAAALAGWLGARGAPRQESPGGLWAALPARPPSLWRSARGALVCLALWFLPLALIAAFAENRVYLDQGLFFSKAAVLTFGGAYAVLPYIAQEAVRTHGWLSAAEMLDGLGLAETTPGPLILVVQFVGFLGAFHSPGALPPLLAGAAAAALVVWVTFVPSFLWILAGAPFVEAFRARPGLSAALAGITAAVVGVILNLALWFALHVVFARVDDRVYWDGGWLRLQLPLPELQSLDWGALAIAILAAFCLFRWKLGMLKTLALGVAAGLALAAARWALGSG